MSAVAPFNSLDLLRPAVRAKVDEFLEKRGRKIAPRRGHWKSGLRGTPDNHLYRILLNGEPVPLAVEADEVNGWVRTYIQTESHLLPATGKRQTAKWTKLTGYVQIIKGDAEYGDD